MVARRDVGYRDELAQLTPDLRGFARALVDGHDADLADEVVQATLVAALTVDQERRGSRLRTWLLGTLTATHRRALRRTGIDQQAGGQHRTAARGAVQAGWPLQRWSGPAAVMDELPLECRETLLLIALEGLSYVQAAECLGVTLNTVIGHLAQAREHLARQDSLTTTKCAALSRPVPYLRLVK